MTKEQRQYNGEKIAFSTKESETIGHPHVKRDLNTDFIPLQKLTQSESWTYIKDVKC